MKTAVITGASAGLGAEFVRQLADVYPEVECYWLIARRLDRLEALAATLPGKEVACISLDLCDPASFDVYQAKLEAEKPEVILLINNAGCGYLGCLGEMDTASQTRMIDLNLRALTAITNITIPHMVPGGNILNVSSIASFCPNPRMTVYSSSKAYVTAFTVGLAEELRSRNITATAVCPGPMETEFIHLGGIKGQSKTFDVLPYCDQVKVVGGALRAARAGRTIYTPKLFYKAYRLLAKVLPLKLMVKFAGT